MDIGFSPPFVVLKTAAMNIDVQVFLLSPCFQLVYTWYISEGEIYESYEDSMFNILRSHKTVFHSS